MSSGSLLLMDCDLFLAPPKAFLTCLLMRCCKLYSIALKY